MASAWLRCSSEAARRKSTFGFALPPQVTGKDEIMITVEVGHTVRSGGDRREIWDWLPAGLKSNS